MLIQSELEWVLYSALACHNRCHGMYNQVFEGPLPVLTVYWCLIVWDLPFPIATQKLTLNASRSGKDLKDSVQTLPLIPSCQFTASSGFRNHLTRAYYLLWFFPRNQLFWVRTNAAFLYLLVQIGHFSVKRRRGLDFFPHMLLEEGYKLRILPKFDSSVSKGSGGTFFGPSLPQSLLAIILTTLGSVWALSNTVDRYSLKPNIKLDK